LILAHGTDVVIGKQIRFMKYQVLLCTIVCTIFSCGNDSGKTGSIKPLSSGKLNNITIVAEIDLWEGESGAIVRNTLGETLYGLPQDEPMFDLYYMPVDVFSGFARKNRTVLQLKRSENSEVNILTNIFAQPQTLIEVKGPDDEAIARQLSLNSAAIMTALQDTEVAEKQRRIGKSLNKDKSINKLFGLTLNFPSAYRMAKAEEGFLWARRDIESGSVNFMIYELNENQLDTETSLLEQILSVRDSVGERHIPGPVEGSFMITEKSYQPRMTRTEIKGLQTYETRSTWELANAFMAGPFVNYTIHDPENSRWIIAEGFVLAPSKDKRDYMLELEAILKSLEIQN